MNGRRSYSSLVIALATVATAVTAGCGDDDAAVTAGVTRPQYVAQADRICAEGDRRLAKEARVALRRSGSRPPDAELERFADERAIPILTERLADLRALEQPASDEAELAEAYAAAERSLDRLRRDPALLERAEAVFRPASRRAAAYGFTECAGRGSAVESLAEEGG